jgi:hypothetical protein
MRKQGHGIEVQKAENGQEIMRKKCSIGQRLKKFVYNAVKSMNVLTYKKQLQSFARIIANQRTEEQQELIANSVFVLCVKTFLKSISMLNQKLVRACAVVSSVVTRGVAGLKVVGVISHKNIDTYCLVVNSTHAFALRGGIVVHNSLDSLRYMLMSRNVGERKRTEPLEPAEEFWNRVRKDLVENEPSYTEGEQGETLIPSEGERYIL